MTLDTVADESRKKTADGVARSLSRLCSRDGKVCCYGGALSTICFLACFCASLPTSRFSFSFSLFSYFLPASRLLISFVSFVCAAGTCYSQQVRILRYEFFLLVSFVPYPISGLFCISIRLVFFFVTLISRVALFFVVLLYPVR